MTTLFARENTRVSSSPSGMEVVLYALAGLVSLGLAIKNFRGGHHMDRAWMHAVTSVLFLFTTAMNLSWWVKARRVV